MSDEGTIGQLVFGVLLGAIAVVGVVQGLDFSGVAASIPIGTALIALVAVTWVIVADARALVSTRKPTTADAAGSAPSSAPAPTGSQGPAVEDAPIELRDLFTSRAALNFVSAGVVIYFLVGSALAMGLTVLLFVRFYGRRSWLNATASAVAMGVLMHLGLTLGMIQHWDGLLSRVL